MSSLTLTSPAFTDGTPIPDRHAYTADDVNPPLRVENVPDGTASLALIVDDPDAKPATGKVFDHWVVWNIDPGVGELPADWDGEGAVEGANGIGETGFLGFNPPDGRHTYKFRLYALDTALDLDAGSSKDDLRAAMDGHVLEETLLEGTFSPEQVPDED